MHKLYIRHWKGMDMPEVMEIEGFKRVGQRSEEELLDLFRQRETISMVGENKDGMVVAWMAWDMLKHRIHISCLEIHPAWQDFNCFEQMIYKAQSKLSDKKYRILSITVRETDLVTQNLLKKMDFSAKKVVRELYEDTGEDGFYFEFHVSQLPEPEILTENSVLST